MKLVGYRKFAVVAAALVSASVLVWLGKIGDGVYSTVMVAVVGSYITGNVWQKVATRE